MAGLITSLLVSNPLTIPLEYYISWKIGTILTNSSLSWEQVEEFMSIIREATMLESVNFICLQGIDMIKSLLLGGVILSIPFAIISYFSALYLYARHQKRRIDRFFKTISDDSEPCNNKDTPTTP